MRHAQNRQRRAFSLVELIVVIGIIAVLLAMLMPALTRAREEANRAKCLVNLRNIGLAAQQFAIEHHNYLPPAGWHWNCVGGVCNPEGLEDSARQKYMYYMDNGILRPLPETAALAIYMQVKVRTDSREHLNEDLNSEALKRLFRCPSQFIDYSGWTEEGDDGGNWLAPNSWSGYDFNAALMGRRDYNTEACPKGRLSRVKQPSKVFLAIDGRPRDSRGLQYLQIPDDNEDQDLYDVQQSILRRGNGAEALDFARHRLRINVVFVDGHEEGFPMGLPPNGGGGLKEIYVSRGIAY